ncbi:MAG TPA: flagellar protein FlaG [Pedomonas sp.]|uniref:flagellar protein FlaG n=1 Tax=Pedomonas sp. TaxID=2976421 RepID=UPI002F3E362A
MDRVAPAGLSAPALVSSGGAPAGASQISRIVPVDGVSAGSGLRNGSSSAQTQNGDSGAETAEEIQRRTAEVVRTAIEDAGAAIDAGSKLVIRKDDDTGRFVYEFRDPHTDEVVKQFPAEEVLESLARFRQAMIGKVLDRQA